MFSQGGVRGALLVVLALVALGCAANNDSDNGTPQSAEDAATIGVAATPEPADTDTDAVVRRVIDGDSVDLEIDGDIVESRLIGINAPELSDCQGPSATDALVRIADGRGVSVRSFGSDRFGRLLVDLSIDGESVNLALVSMGWALAQHDNEHGSAALWVEAMEAAAASALGMWDLPEHCPPPQGQIEIASVEPDPPGPDNEVLEDEWIELENTGTTTIELDGWAVRDESTSNRFVFEGGTLEPGERLRLRTGCGTDSPEDRYWCSRGGVWSNRGDTALVLGPSGSIEDWVFLE